MDVLLTREGLAAFKTAALELGYVEKLPGCEGASFSRRRQAEAHRVPHTGARTMCARHRLKDLADVVETIRALSLPRDLGARLDPSVRAKFDELWVAAQARDPE